MSPSTVVPVKMATGRPKHWLLNDNNNDDDDNNKNNNNSSNKKIANHDIIELLPC